MHIKSVWSNLNRGLLIILSFLIVSALASIIFLAHSLFTLRDVTTRGGNAVATALVLQDIIINLQDTQSGTRGYILTGDPVFLKTYETGTKRVPMDISTLEHNPQIILSQKDRERIIALTKQRIQIADNNVALYRSGGFDVAKAEIATRNGENVMTELRSTITDITSKDLQDIGPMQLQSIHDVRRALWVAAALAVFIMSTCVAIVWYFRRTILHERALESTKNEFLSLASHQLRTPATNVKQYVALLLDGYMGDLTDEQRRALDIAYKNNEAEIRIMNTLLDVAKLDLDRIELHRKITNLTTVIKHVVKDYAPLAKEAGLKIYLDVPSQLMASVDEGYVEGVLDNLLDNAIKYSKSGTRISIKLWREGEYACIAVRDQGLGIRKRDFGKLFTKFTRLDNEFSANSQGSGLGLYWVKKIISLHRGTIELASHEGKGSVFTVRLPVR